MGSMWELETLIKPMDKEANRLKNMYREKVWQFLFQIPLSSRLV
jgi:hypothetical protein